MEHINLECNKQTNNLRTLSSHLVIVCMQFYKLSYLSSVEHKREIEREGEREREMKWGVLFVHISALPDTIPSQPTDHTTTKFTQTRRTTTMTS